MAGSHTIAENILQIQHLLDEYALSYARSGADIQLLAVSKGQSADAIRTAHACGLRYKDRDDVLGSGGEFHHGESAW